ncbi:gas vesicle protein GvpO [Teichococcus cervicalis]|uniref:Gas vesicle synthesis protein GvpO n=2 Tax=Teichococcus cervicalis TaxID=204525 RepID=D5RTM5_9PROT|nr:gas vesicle protein GvpO [Pseudoroseomonas cervicalis]EFH09342.1 gas vesicle synthesis protein GvpO [Pseudoroseomonas cervicalis ATCC 49957]
MDPASEKACMDPATLVSQARRQLEALLSQPTETVSRFEPTEEGWLLHLDVLEHHAIPRTHDLIARYEVALDPGGGLRRWKRTSRGQRGQMLDES